MHEFWGKEKGMFCGYIFNLLDEYDELKIYSSIDGIYEYIYKRLFMLSIRSLIYEMHIFKREGKLFGKTSEERFISFEKITETERFKKYFEKKYPVLICKMRESIVNIYNYVCEIYGNFEKDKELLEENIYHNIREIKNIVIGEGDTHNNGKSVAIVYTNESKLIYKPHSLSCDYSFEKLLNWINKQGIKCDLQSLKYINGENYGWQEYIEYEGNLTNQEAEEYYYKCGVFLGLFYILGTTDIHFENIIVHKNNPYFVDLETLVSIPKYIDYSSILETDFIPGLYNNVVYDFDYSGLCGQGNVSSKIKTISIINPKTDDMRIEYVESHIRENKNIVWVDGEKVKIEDYSQEILDGFKEIWDLIFLKKSEFISLIDEVFSDDTLYYRQVLRATQVYSKFLAAASHPDYLDKEENQKMLFQRLLSNVSDTKMLKRIQDEISQLCGGDVPYFMVKYNNSDLYSPNGVVYRHYYDYTVRDCIIKRIVDPIPNNKIVQTDTIRKSLFTAYNTQFVEEESNEKINKTNFIEKTATEICNRIVDDSTGTIMLINSLIGDRFYLTGMNLDIYEGGGIIWFLACYGKLENISNIYKLSSNLFDTTEKYLNNQSQRECIHLSAFSGSGSILYLSYNLFLLTNENKYYECFKKHSNELIQLTSNLEIDFNDVVQFDYICGISGLLIVLCRIYEKECDELLKDYIFKLKEKLLGWLEKTSLRETGIAHGISGIVYALIVLDKTFYELNYKEISISLLRRELDIYTAKEQFNLEWCYGISGLIFVRTLAYLLWNDISIQIQLSELFILFKETNITKQNNCLCHGIRGIKESMLIVQKLLGNKYTEVDRVLNNLEEYDFWGLNHHSIENFMMGTSGVAYSYLKSKYDKLPSIMALEVFNT